MAIYYFNAQIISRSSGRSSVAATAYRAGEKLHNDRDGITHDYTRRTCVVHSEIILPKDAPKEFFDRSTLWNAVEKSEKRKDSQTARELVMALPREFSRDEQVELVRKYVQDNFVDKGMCADFAIHDKNDGNPHSHIMLTTREVSVDGFGKKNRDWNKTELLDQWRENWAHICNEKLLEKGLVDRIDHRTLEAQGIDREPTIHLGPTVCAMEKRGLACDRMKEFREIVERNEAREAAREPAAVAEYMQKLRDCHEILTREINELRQQDAQATRDVQRCQRRAEEIEEHAANIQTRQSRIAEVRAERAQTNGHRDGPRPVAQSGENAKQSERDNRRSLFGVLKDIRETHEVPAYHPQTDRELDELLRRHERNLQQALDYFVREYHIEPSQSDREAARLEAFARELDGKTHAPEIAEYAARREEITREYQKQLLLARLRPDGQEILEAVDRHAYDLQRFEARNNIGRSITRDTRNDAERGTGRNASHGTTRNTPHDFLSHAESARELKNITPERFERILQEVTPIQAERIREMRQQALEHERIRERERMR